MHPPPKPLRPAKFRPKGIEAASSRRRSRRPAPRRENPMRPRRHKWKIAAYRGVHDFRRLWKWITARTTKMRTVGQALAMGGQFYQMREMVPTRLGRGARADFKAQKTKGPRREGVMPVPDASARSCCSAERRTHRRAKRTRLAAGAPTPQGRLTAQPSGKRQQPRIVFGRAKPTPVLRQHKKTIATGETCPFHRSRPNLADMVRARREDPRQGHRL